jgi:hypothetical protein
MKENMEKKKDFITEQEISAEFVLYIIEEAQKAWPTVYKGFNNIFKQSLEVENETMAAFDLALALIAQGLQPINNLFPKEQAKRIEKWVFKGIDSEEWGEYATQEVKEYINTFTDSVKNIKKGEDPISAIPLRLIYKWFGYKGKEIVTPMAVLMIADILSMFLGFWKNVNDNFNVVEGDLPLNYDLKELQKHKTEQDINEQDVLMKNRYRVLIKGPWEGIKEDIWELEDDIIDKFVDEENIAYVIAYYEKGELKNYFVKKRAWQNQEKIEKIVMNNNLTQEEKRKKIKKLILKN